MFALAHPAMRVPRAPTRGRGEDEDDRPRHVDRGDPGVDRDDGERQQVRHEGDPGREAEDPAVGGPRGDVLLLDELHPVGDELGPAVEAAGVHRAEPALHVRHDLVLGLARRAAAGRGRRRGRWRPGRRPRAASSGTPLGRRDAGRLDAAAARAAGGVVALAGLLAARPRLARPRGQLEGLAQRRALEAVGEEQRADAEAGAVVEPVEGRGRTSRRSRARARRRRRRPR